MAPFVWIAKPSKPSARVFYFAEVTSGQRPAQISDKDNKRRMKMSVIRAGYVVLRPRCECLSPVDSLDELGLRERITGTFATGDFSADVNRVSYQKEPRTDADR
jgi:hypothetical protein